MKEDVVEKFSEFLREYYYKQLNEAAGEDKKSILIDFSLLEKFDPELADSLLERPQENIKYAEESIKEIDTGLAEKKLRLRFFNLPEDNLVRIRDIRANHIGKFITVDGIVRRAGEIRPEVTETIFSCPNCSNRISVAQNGGKGNSQMECDCGYKGRLSLIDQELIDSRWITVDEPYESTTGERPSTLIIFLNEDLTSPRMRNKTEPGNRIRVVGTLMKTPKRIKGSISRQMEIYLEANSVEAVEVEWEELETSADDEKKIKKLAKDPEIFEKIIGSIAPAMYGMEDVKLAIALQLFGGEQHVLKDKTKIRGYIHVLLVGEPATGKCLTGDAKVIQADGSIKKIKDMVEDSVEKSPRVTDDGFYAHTNHDILSLNGNGKISSKKSTVVWKREAPENMFRIETSTGKRICVTPTHPILVLNGGVEFEEAEKIKVGEYIATPRRIGISGKIQELSTKIAISKANAAHHIRIPKTTSPEFCRFIGYLVGEGYLYRAATSIHISVTNNDDFILGDFEECARKLFGVNVSERLSRKHKSAREKYICSIELGRFLENLEPSLFKPSREKRVPDVIMKCSDKEVGEFLKAYFDGEASVSKKEREIEVTSASEELLEQVQILLLRFGIISQLHPTYSMATNTPNPKKRKYYRLRISGENLIRFANEIGFNTRRKKERVLNAVKRGKICTNIDLIPNISRLLMSLRRRLLMTQFDFGVPRACYQHYDRDDRFPTRDNLLRVVKGFDMRMDGIRKLANSIGESNWQKLRNIRNNLRLSQQAVASHARVSQTLISQYELGKCGNSKIKPRVKNVTKTTKVVKGVLRKICENILNDSEMINQLELLRTLATSDVFWDKVVRVEKIKSREKWVYDLQVDGTHNFIGNCIVVHNSQLMQLVTKMMPRGKYVSGMGVSYAGFTAAAVRDEELGWQLEAGALVLANNSLCAVDEISKVAPQDLVALLQAMSIGSISIAKAAIVATLPAQTSILAGGNPKLGRFDPFKPIREQIDIDDVLMSRFDLKFALQDKPDSDMDAKMTEHIFEMRHFNEEKATPIIDPDLLKKYIAYAKAYCHPKLTKKAANKIREFYLQMRARGGEGAAVPITLRQCEAMIRLAEASAKIRLSDTVSTEDAERAIRLMKVSLMQFGFDTETKQFDIDRAEGQIATAAQRGKIRNVEKIIDQLAEKNGENIQIKDVIDIGKKQGIDDVEKIVKKMCNEGILFSPRLGIIKKV